MQVNAVLLGINLYKEKRSGSMRQGEVRIALPGIILPSLNHEELRMLSRLTTENKL